MCMRCDERISRIGSSRAGKDHSYGVQWEFASVFHRDPSVFPLVGILDRVAQTSVMALTMSPGPSLFSRWHRDRRFHSRRLTNSLSSWY
jgi:hypothetical protein